MRTTFRDKPLSIRPQRAPYGQMPRISRDLTSPHYCTRCAFQEELNPMIREIIALQQKGRTCLARLTGRQREIMHMVLAGHPSKNIAADLRISQRTVENHRAQIMYRTSCKSVPELSRLVFCASWEHGADPSVERRGGDRRQAGQQARIMTVTELGA